MGMACSKRITLLDATNEKGVVITRSLELISAARTQRCNPAVPELTPMACLLPVYSVNAHSKPAMRVPMLKLEVFKTSATAALSASVMSGEDIGTCCFGLTNFSKKNIIR